jgi:hypothetical protein
MPQTLTYFGSDERSQIERRGIPHLAKNERDMGPTQGSVAGKDEKGKTLCRKVQERCLKRFGSRM